MRHAHDAVVHRRHLFLIALALGACDDDATHELEAEPCHIWAHRMSCLATETTFSEEFYPGDTSSTLCLLPPITTSVTCPSGCAIQGWRLTYVADPSDPVESLRDPSVLCKGAPERKVGDPCSGEGSCQPTVARLNDDGTVASMSYLTCSGGTCVEAPPPVYEGYLEGCDPDVVAYRGGAGVLGVVTDRSRTSSEACLLAWDETAQATASGRTLTCVGDWQCPVGSLCDDQIPLLNDGRGPICKPGPRGTLTPAMLSR
jgi:hypothetical protein